MSVVCLILRDFLFACAIIFLCCVQIIEEDASLVEIGPRFVLNIIKLFQGSFGGPTLYENPGFKSPNMVKSSACYVRFQASDVIQYG